MHPQISRFGYQCMVGPWMPSSLRIWPSPYATSSTGRAQMRRLRNRRCGAESPSTYLSSYEGDRFVESMRYVRSYPTELPILRDLLPGLHTPVKLIADARDPAVPPVNAEFLHKRLPNSKLDILDAGHFTWEDAADEYAALVTSWWSRHAKTASQEEALS
jgi:pimeloyl-ACP methyl ester carboxylesterase